VSGQFSWYELLMLAGLLVTIWKTFIANPRLIKRLKSELGGAKADVEKLMHKHPTNDSRHQAVFSPGEDPKENP
jgi:hypothetical protein